MRGRGWLSSFPVGNTAPAPGLPIVNTSRWDTGVQAHGVNGMVEWTGAVTAGSLSDPRFRDNNGGRQLAGRVVVRPIAAAGVRRVGVARRVARSRRSTRDVAGADVDDASQQARSAATPSFRPGRSWCAARSIRSTWTMPRVRRRCIERAAGRDLDR